MDTQVTSRPTRILFQERDHTIFDAINYHGPLSVPYLCGLGGDDASLYGLKNRLGDLTRAGWLWRPGQKFKTIARTDYQTYANTPTADDYFLGMDRFQRKSKKLSAWNLHHETFLAHITASIQLGAAKHGFEFLKSFPPIMPVSITDAANLYNKEMRGWEEVSQSSDKALQPDAYFRLRSGDSECAFLVEADCGNESTYKVDLDQKSWRATILKYRTLIESGAYKKHLGINCGVLVLLVFNSKSQMEDAQQFLLNNTDGKGANYILWKTWADFHSPLFVPREVNCALYEDPWYRVGTDEKTKLPYEPMYI